MLRAFCKPKDMIVQDLLMNPVEVDGVVHHLGEFKSVNISSSDYCREHFPNPDDYTLENLMKSGAQLDEVASPFIGGTPQGLDSAVSDSLDYLNNDENFK